MLELELSKFYKAYKILKEREFGDKPELFLHKNSNESDLTLGGIYAKYWKKEIDWDFVYSLYRLTNYDLKRTSVMLYSDNITRASVMMFFKKKFWDTCRLDEIQSNKICAEIFISAVHVGSVEAIKLAQKVIGVEEDGIIGKITIKALNNFSEARFDIEFDEAEIKNYASKKTWKLYKQGFTNRAYSV